jgi:uncharacterized repeat protein (TIGR01451 family)
MATFVVTSNADNPANVTADDGTLRGEILASNATTTANEIDFSLPSGLSANTITLKSSLPTITTPLYINGSTAAGFSNAPLVQITGLGSNGNVSGPAFNVSAANSRLSDLIINNFVGDAVRVFGANTTIDGDWIGIDATGTAAASNTGDGLFIGSANNSIGGIAFLPNVIAANGNNDIEINGSAATGNIIEHTYVGTNASGTAVLNTTPAGYGIAISSAKNTIGGPTTPGNFSNFGNLISGTQEGITLFSGANQNVIEGNLIGTDITGNVPLGNVDFGIYVSGGSNNTIGGLNGGFFNVISGNGNDGIRVQGVTATLNQIQGNLIGVGLDRTTAVGNGHWGVQINGASNNVVGGTVFDGTFPAYGNTINNNGTLGTGGGVLVVRGTGDGILSNGIYNNNGLPGISLNGANAGVKAPVITQAQSGAGQTRITGTYTGTPNTAYRIQFFSSQTANPTGIGDGQTYLPDVMDPFTGFPGDLDIFTDAQGKASINCVLTPLVPVGFFVTATATQNVIVTNNTSPFSTAVASTQAAVTDLSVGIVAPNPAPLLDQPYEYDITVKNNGPNDATGVVLTDTLPTNSTLISTTGGTVTGGVLTDNIGPLATGASVTIVLFVKPTATGKLIDTASVTGNELDPVSTNNTATTATQSGPIVAPNSDLQVSLTPDSSTVAVGSPVTYFLSIGNNGPSTASGTTVTIQFPSTFQNIAVMPDQGAYTINPDNSVTINTGIVPASSATTVKLVATPTVTGSEDTTAIVSSNVLDPNPNNNGATATIIVANAADLGVSILADPSPVLIGQELIYTIVATNKGPSAASLPTVTDLLPAGQTYDAANSSIASGTGSLTLLNGVVTAALAPLASGASETITIAVMPTVAGQFTNTVSISDPDPAHLEELDPDTTNNTASTQVLVNPADLAVTVVNPADPLFIGQNAVYQIQVTNNGPAVATNVVLHDTLQGVAGSIVATSVGNGSGTDFTANIGSIGVGQTVTVYLAFDPTSSGTLINSADVSTADEFDNNPNNNTSSSSNLVSPADLVLAMTGPTDPVLLGQPLTFVVTVTNTGPAAATNVIFNDTLPAGTTVASLVVSQGSVAGGATADSLIGNLGTLAPGASATVTITLNTTATQIEVNSASVTSDNLDPNPDNNSTSLSATVYNVAGTIQGSSSAVFVPENAGSVTVTINRVGGTLGTVTANYATQDYTGKAGVNYVATSGTVTFLDGQTTATITIPVLDDFQVNGTNAFFLVLTNPTGGATIGSPAVIGVGVTNTDRDLTPPTVTQLLAIPNGNLLNGFALTFSKAMDPATAGNVGNYHLFSQTAAGKLAVVPLAAVQYNDFNHTVILVPFAPLPGNHFYRIIANGNAAGALMDTSGNTLSGDSGVGSNYDIVYGQGTKLTYNDAQQNVVTLNLSGGGILGVYLTPTGEASLVTLYNTVPHSSKLTGSVKKLNKHGSGHTYIGAINGFGQFGNVRSTLTTPSFYVGSAPVSAFSVPVPVTVSAESLPVPTVTAKKATPKGPARVKH